ncbi:uncharacterized protein BP01DRAFT_381998 [Aspergillus saccharolyticus JOP 1030-1]|uniref:C2H2-type domain-containing protein n=1 Tax=Aspergillus saccharolyticus JOP 1030-1 TaxID=1450539 RepID=A0A318ZQY9_9EURO|nr:hypothetical protein BP01DRAFT_381998 [Aspergillus saccharolyticus JOP 1030-1]PYH46370.1 hypothetical protein BP01DRAFT_381998 [Aspergillus saccharolyticus JOP 1030-1]
MAQQYNFIAPSEELRAAPVPIERVDDNTPGFDISMCYLCFQGSKPPEEGGRFFRCGSILCRSTFHEGCVDEFLWKHWDFYNGPPPFRCPKCQRPWVHQGSLLEKISSTHQLSSGGGKMHASDHNQPPDAYSRQTSSTVPMPLANWQPRPTRHYPPPPNAYSEQTTPTTLVPTTANPQERPSRFVEPPKVGSKPRFCPFCVREYTESEPLMRHLLYEHLSEPRVCMLCNTEMGSWSSLLDHWTLDIMIGSWMMS